MGTIQENFSKVETLIRVSPHTFRLVCTGRLNCYGAELHLQLKPRQDLMSQVMSLVTASPETVVVEVPLSDKLEPFVLALFPPRKEKRLRDELVDLALTKPRDSPVGGLVFLCDASEVVQKVFPSDVIVALQKSVNLIHLIYCTDSFSLYETDYKQMARFVLRLPTSEQEKAEFDLLLKTVFRLVDLFVSVTLPPPRLLKNRAARKRMQSAKTKESREGAEAKLEEKKLAALAAEREKIETLTGKERQKAEDKMRKKEAKEKLKTKMKVIR